MKKPKLGTYVKVLYTDNSFQHGYMDQIGEVVENYRFPILMVKFKKGTQAFEANYLKKIKGMERVLYGS